VPYDNLLPMYVNGVRFLRAVSALTITWLAAATALAQAPTIHGTVTDAQSVAMPGVTVTLTTGAAAGRRITTTDGSGEYRFDGMTPGTFRLVFDRAGFELVTRAGTLVADGTGGEISVTMPIAGVSTSIDVTDVAGKATASRLDVSDRDLPVQVSSIPQQLLEQQGVNDMVTALRNASGVQAQRWYGGVYEYYTIRGFNQADVMLVDGLRLEGNRFNTQLNNIESVEILKGPASVLYGGSALGGIINVVRKKPQGTRTYDFSYRGGRFNSHQVAGGATGPLIGNSWLYRVNASFDHSDGWRGAGADRVNVSPSLTWLMSERARVTIYQAFNRDRFAGDGGVPISLINAPGFDLSRRFSTPYDFALVEDSQTQVLFNANLSNRWEFRDGFLLRRTSDEYFVTEFVFHEPALNQVGRNALYFHHTRRPVLNQADVVGRFDFLNMHHTVLAGHEYQDFYTRTDTTPDGGDIPLTPISLANFQETNPPITTFDIVRETYQANRIHAFFWQDQIDVTSKLKINVGGRFDNYYRQRHRIFTADPNTITGVQTRDQNAYTYRAGIVYSPWSTHQFYFNSSSAFTPVTTIPPNGAELNPQTGRSFEVGHRWQGLSGRLQTSLAFYHLEQNNLTFRETLTSVIQAGQQRSRGVDLDINANLGWGTRLIANYGYSQPVFTEFDDLTGFQPRFVQKHAANVWLTKSWNSGFVASIGNRYLGPMFTNNENTIRLGGWNTFGGAVGYRHGLWEFHLNAENLFNRARYFTGSDFEDQIYPGPPINVFATIRFRFY